VTNLNQYELSRMLGSQMLPTKGVRFGGFGLLQTTAEVLQAQERFRNRTGDEPTFDYEQDRLIVQAFEDVRDGSSIDALLWDQELLGRFVTRCRELGFDNPVRLLSRRLMNVRKNKARYVKRGIILSPTTRKEPRLRIVPRYAPVVEFALVAMRYRYGTSIDDILLDPILAEDFERRVREIAPELSGEELRRAALCIRKSREDHEIQELDVESVDREMSPAKPLSEIDVESLPEKSGLVEVDEEDRHLYVVRVANVRPLVRELVAGDAFRIVQNSFWTPDLSSITMRYVCGNRVAGFALKKWEEKLIHDYDPVFNWPMHKMAL
jgi:hypothetical protein